MVRPRKGETAPNNQILLDLLFYRGFDTEDAPQVTDWTTNSIIDQK
jgi:hypothetical protein